MSDLGAVEREDGDIAARLVCDQLIRHVAGAGLPVLPVAVVNGNFWCRAVYA